MAWDWKAPETWGVAAEVVTAIVGVWAVAAVGRWRSDKRAEKRAEVAQQAVAAIVRAMNAVWAFCYLPGWVSLDLSRAAAKGRVRSESEYANALERAHDLRDAPAAAAYEELLKAYAAAEVHLAEQEVRPVRLALRGVESIRQMAREYVARVVYGIDSAKEVDRTLTLEWPSKVKKLEADAKEVLLPIAQYRSPGVLLGLVLQVFEIARVALAWAIRPHRAVPGESCATSVDASGIPEASAPKVTDGNGP